MLQGMQAEGDDSGRIRMTENAEDPALLAETVGVEVLRWVGCPLLETGRSGIDRVGHHHLVAPERLHHAARPTLTLHVWRHET